MAKLPPMERAQTCLIGAPGSIARVVLPKRHRFLLLLQYDNAPIVIPLDDPGHYEVDVTPIVTGMRWPVAIMTIKAKHVAAWEGVEADVTNKVLDACMATVRKSLQ